MRICICDDDLIMHEEIRNCLLYFYTKSNLPTITDFYCGEDLIKHYSESQDFDIIFLDIEMGKLNGLDTAAEVKKYAPESIIIFVSSHKNYVFDAFRCEAFHFLVKPIKQEEFNDVFDRALHKYRTAKDIYVVNWHNCRESFRICDILYIEGYKRRLKVHVFEPSENSVKVEVHEHIGKISETYERLKEHGFVMIHQGFIVNMKYIKMFGSKEVVLSDGTTKLIISGRKRPDALKTYDMYIRKWKW